MQKGSILELERVQKEKHFKEEKDVRAVSRFLVFLPKLILITLLACLLLFLAGLVHSLVQYYLTGEFRNFLPEANQVINFVRSSRGLLAMGAVLTIILFIFALRVTFEKKNKKLNDEQANEAEGLKMFQALPEIEESEGPKKVIPFPNKKKALKKVYGKLREQEKIKNEEKLRKKDKPKNKLRGCYHNSGQRGNVVIFKQKRLSAQRGVCRSVTPRVAAAANRINNRIKWSTQTQTVNQTLLRRCFPARAAPEPRGPL